MEGRTCEIPISQVKSVCLMETLADIVRNAIYVFVAANGCPELIKLDESYMKRMVEHSVGSVISEVKIHKKAKSLMKVFNIETIDEDGDVIKNGQKMITDQIIRFDTNCINRSVNAIVGKYKDPRMVRQMMFIAEGINNSKLNDFERREFGKAWWGLPTMSGPQGSIFKENTAPVSQTDYSEMLRLAIKYGKSTKSKYPIMSIPLAMAGAAHIEIGLLALACAARVRGDVMEPKYTTSPTPVTLDIFKEIEASVEADENISQPPSDIRMVDDTHLVRFNSSKLSPHEAFFNGDDCNICSHITGTKGCCCPTKAIKWPVHEAKKVLPQLRCGIAVAPSGLCAAVCWPVEATMEVRSKIGLQALKDMEDYIEFKLVAYNKMVEKLHNKSKK